MGIPVTQFKHYYFKSGENKGDPPSIISSSELSRGLNVENRGRGYSTRKGSSIINVDVNGYASPISGNPDIKNIASYTYGGTYDAIFNADTSVYHTPATPVAIRTGMTAGLTYQYAQQGAVMYGTNGTDPAFFMDKVRSTTTTYTAGYSTPGTFTATPGAAGSMNDGTYSYIVIWYDENTETRSNPQATAVTATTTAGVGAGSVALTSLPLDSEDRTSHWIIYRKDPGGYYFFRLARVAYDAGAPSYTDTAVATGVLETLEYDNYAPDDSDGVCYSESQKRMLYFRGDVLTWSKPFRSQCVPTRNREILADKSEKIQKVVEVFKRYIIVFKNNSMYAIIGSLGGAYRVEKFSSTVGTVSPDSVCVSTDGIFFLDSGGIPRYITTTDFTAEELRTSTNISFKFSKKFDDVQTIFLMNAFGIIWEKGSVAQWRLYVPIESVSGICDHVYVYDFRLASVNGGESAWFDFRYNTNMLCAAVVDTSSGKSIYCGDDYGLLWKQDDSTQYDGDEYYRDEDTGTMTVTAGTSSVVVTATHTDTIGVDQYAGMFVILYDEYSFIELFRSRITANTATPAASITFTIEDALPSLGSNNPAVVVGGYLTYLSTPHFTRDGSGKNVPDKIKVTFDTTDNTREAYIFVNYDLNDVFNYTYNYHSDRTLSSKTTKGDTYLVSIGDSEYYYDDPDTVYDTASYAGSTFESVNFLLRNYYWFSHVTWGIITREPSRSFNYQGGTLYFRGKGSYL